MGRRRGLRARLRGWLVDMDEIYAEVRERAQNDPGILELLRARPELRVSVERTTTRIAPGTLRASIVQLLADGFFQGATNAIAVAQEVALRGRAATEASVRIELRWLECRGFLERTEGGWRVPKDLTVVAGPP